MKNYNFTKKMSTIEFNKKISGLTKQFQQRIWQKKFKFQTLKILLRGLATIIYIRISR